MSEVPKKDNPNYVYRPGPFGGVPGHYSEVPPTHVNPYYSPEEGVMGHSPEYRGGERALQDMPGWQRWFAGMGTWPADLYHGTMQHLGFESQDEIDRRAARDAALRNDPAGASGAMVGDFAGGYALSAGLGTPFLASRFPAEVGAARSALAAATPAPVSAFARTVAGGPLRRAALTSGGMQAAQPTTSDESYLPQVAAATLAAPVLQAPLNLAHHITGPISRTPEQLAWAEYARKTIPGGGQLPAYAYGDPFWKSAESVFGGFPYAGSRQKVGEEATRNYTRAVGRLLDLDTDNLATAVPARQAEIGDAIGKFRDQYGIQSPVNLAQFNKLVNAASVIPGIKGGTKAPLAEELADMQNQIKGFMAAGPIDGATYTTLKQNLTNLADRLDAAGMGRIQTDPKSPGLNPAVVLRQELDKAFQRTMAGANVPQADRELYAKLNQQYETSKILYDRTGNNVHMLYDPDTGLIDPGALSRQANKDTGQQWITSQSTMPSGNPNPRVDLTNLGAQPEWRQVGSDISHDPSASEHGMHLAGMVGSPVALGAAGYLEAGHDESTKDKLENAGIFAGAGTLAGLVLGRRTHRPGTATGWVDTPWSLAPLAARATSSQVPFDLAPMWRRYTGKTEPSGSAQVPAPSNTPQWELGDPVDAAPQGAPPAAGAQPAAPYVLGEPVK